MMTVVTYVTLKEGTAPEWDVAMRARLEAAKSQEGWVRGQLLMPLDDLTKRLGADVRVLWPGGETGPWTHVSANGFALLTRGAAEAHPWSPAGG